MMCGACAADRGGADWARPWVAGPAARAAVAAAVSRLRPSSRTRISPVAGGWLVARPTGGSTVCGTLGELVTAVRSASPGPETPLDPARPSGPLTVPPAADGRRGVVVRVDPHAPPRDLATALSDTALSTSAPSTGASAAFATTPSATALSEEAAVPEGAAPALVVVPDEGGALGVLALLASPAWLRRVYLARLEGAAAPWGARPAPTGSPCQGDPPVPCVPGFGADVVVRLEWARQEGRFDGTAVAVRWPLGGGALLDVEVRAGHLVRALTLRPGTAAHGKAFLTNL
ncbi:hypothetical protein [Nonomuraea sp. NPDC050691]|uniref:hypothetical protein n=1 Tax=Nonomuraea sp. NPDC050691 TaxID=3155661 RepID=UPI0033D5EA7C